MDNAPALVATTAILAATPVAAAAMDGAVAAATLAVATLAAATFAAVAEWTALLLLSPLLCAALAFCANKAVLQQQFNLLLIN